MGLLGFYKKSSRILTAVILFFVWILSWNNSLGDFDAYELYYNSDLTDFRDIGYYVLTNYLFRFGLSFLQTKLVIMAFSLCILYRFIVKYSVWHTLVASLYLLTFCFYDIEQYRNFFAFSLVLLGLIFLFDNKYKAYSKIIFAICVLVGFTIHASVIVFLMFLIIDKNTFKSLKNFVLRLFLPSLIAVYFMSKSISMVSERVEYYENAISQFSKIMVVAMYVLNAIYIYTNSRKKPSFSNTFIEGFVNDENSTMPVANVLFFITLPFVFQSLNYLRLFKYLCVINVVYLSNLLFDTDCLRISHRKVAVLSIYAFFVLGIFYFMHPSFFDKVLQPLLFNNMLLD